jgi:hypothetical protein
MIEVSGTGFRRVVGSCNFVLVKRGSVWIEWLFDFKRDSVPHSWSHCTKLNERERGIALSTN